MKKVLSITILLAVLLFTLCSCTQIDDPQSLENCSVVIEEFRLSTDFLGRSFIVVKYAFTNKSDEPASFSGMINDYAFQNGIRLSSSLTPIAVEDFSIENQFKEIKKGTTISVEVAYELEDNISDVEIEISERLSRNNKKITKNFSIG